MFREQIELSLICTLSDDRAAMATDCRVTRHHRDRLLSLRVAAADDGAASPAYPKRKRPQLMAAGGRWRPTPMPLRQQPAASVLKTMTARGASLCSFGVGVSAEESRRH